MKTYSLISILTLALTACSDHDPNFFRSSQGIPTEEISMYVYADVHSHIEQGGQLAAPHTTVYAELFGRDKDGYYYNIELADTDELNATLGTTAVPLLNHALPSEPYTKAVTYSEDFDNTTPSTAFTVALNRELDAEVASIPVTLLEDAAFTVQPNSTEFNLSDTLTLEWSENSAYEYKLKFKMMCEFDESVFKSLSVGFPNRNVTSIASPFTFNPSNFFTQPESTTLVGCNLHSSLYSIEEQGSPGSSNLESVFARATRQHIDEKTLILIE